MGAVFLLLLLVLIGLLVWEGVSWISPAAADGYRVVRWLAIVLVAAAAVLSRRPLRRR
jgi:hypothetical protein